MIHLAGGILRHALPHVRPLPRQARVAVLGSYTTRHLVQLLPLAAARCGVDVPPGTLARGAEAAARAGQVAVVDREALASSVGKRAWFDARYWFRSKQAISLACLPHLTRHAAATRPAPG